MEGPGLGPGGSEKLLKVLRRIWVFIFLVTFSAVGRIGWKECRETLWGQRSGRDGNFDKSRQKRVGDSIKGWHLRQKVEWTSLWELDSAWPFSWEVFLVAQMVQNPPAMRETWVRSLGWEDLLEEGMATHSSILAWRIPMDRGAWRATVHGVAKSRTRLSD